MKLKYIIVVTIVCASVFGQAHSLLDLSRTLALKAPDPKAVAAAVLECLRLEFEYLVVVALNSVILIARGALIASLCLNTPCDYDEIIRPKIQEVFDRFQELQAVSASEVIEQGLTEQLKSGPWNLVTQELFVVNILFAIEKKLGGIVVENCLNETFEAVVPYAECDNSAFPELFRLAVKLLFDRIALVGSTIATLNVQNYFLGRPCGTLPILNLTVPLPFPY